MSGRGGRVLVAVLALAVLVGCASAKLNGSVTEFSAVTGEAVKMQRQALSSYATTERQRIRAELARERVGLALSTGCIGLESAPQQLDNCYVTRLDGTPIEVYAEPEHVLALGTAMETYALQLNRLAGDAAADSRTFSASLMALATSVGSLDGAIAKISSQAAVPQKRLDAVASIAASVGNLVLASQRAEALRRIIIASDDTVQSATSSLAQADEALRGAANIAALQALSRAEAELETAVSSNAATTVIEQKQGAFLKLFDEFRQRAATQSAWTAIGSAHHKLADVARSGASPADILAFTKQLMTAARSIALAAQNLGATS